MSRIIGISGKIGSGKDEAYLTIENTFDKWENKKYAEKLKLCASLLLGIPRADLESREVKDRFLPGWNMTVREFMQKLGTDAVRFGLHENAWVLALFSDLKDDSRWIITDVRFPNEVAAIKELGGHVIRINRPGLDTGTHASETSLDDFDGFDAVINNSGTLEEFRRAVLTTFVTLSLQWKIQI